MTDVEEKRRDFLSWLGTAATPDAAAKGEGLSFFMFHGNESSALPPMAGERERRPVPSPALSRNPFQYVQKVEVHEEVDQHHVRMLGGASHMAQGMRRITLRMWAYPEAHELAAFSIAQDYDLDLVALRVPMHGTLVGGKWRATQMQHLMADSSSAITCYVEFIYLMV